MRRRWPQILSTVVVLLLALVVALINAQGGADGSPTATPRPASAIAAAASTATTRPATTQASANTSATRPLPTATRTAVRAATVAPTARTLPLTPTPDGKLPTISTTQLPKEAQETIRLIDRGGPFPYDRDGITFGNRERLLPIKSDGYYREYTVITPGSSDRGARRIVAGRDGELYYTDDHYESFRRIVR